MTDVSHELGALRHVVDSSLSSKVAMFNNQAKQHKNSQLLNPFSTPDGRSSPKPTFSKGEYGKPLAGSLTEMRGQKANMHVMREMLELCQIINSEGYDVKDEPGMRVIPFGELFNIYNYISDKVVGILLRARKYKYVEFEGEMLFQRRDDDVPVFLLRPIADIRHELDAKIEEIKRGSSPAPQSTSVLLDKAANDQRLKELAVPKSARNSKSRSQSPAAAHSKASSPVPSTSTKTPTPTPTTTTTECAKPPPSPTAPKKPANASSVTEQPAAAAAPVKPETADAATATTAAAAAVDAAPKAQPEPAVVITVPTPEPEPAAEVPVKPTVEAATQSEPIKPAAKTEAETATGAAVNADAANVAAAETQTVAAAPESSRDATVSPATDANAPMSSDLPTIVIEASAVYVRSASVAAAAEPTPEPQLTTAQPEPEPKPGDVAAAETNSAATSTAV